MAKKKKEVEIINIDENATCFEILGLDKENATVGTLIISPNFGRTLKQAEERFPYASVSLTGLFEQ